MGFSVEELQRLSKVFEIMTKWCTAEPRKALFKWDISKFKKDKASIKELITRTQELHLALAAQHAQGVPAADP